MVTLYDVIESTLVDAGMRNAPATVFDRDVWPIFQRMSDLQWVNAGFFAKFGFDGPRDWTTQAWRERLADAASGNAALRTQVFGLFRDPAFTQVPTRRARASECLS